MNKILSVYLFFAVALSNAQLDTTGILGSYNTTRKEVQRNFMLIDSTKSILKDTAAAIRASMPVASQSNWNEANASSPSYIQNKPTIPIQNVYNAGNGIGKAGAEPNALFYVDSSKFMSISNAQPIINTMQNDINGKVPNARNITINGVTQNLSTDRTWTIPTYTDANVRAAISLTTTGTSGAASYNNTTGVLNVPQYQATVPTYSKSALLGNGVVIVDTFTIASATPTVSFSSILSTTGKSNFKILSATGYRASATASNSPQVAVTALTSNSATFSITQQNTATVTILGINVLSGLPLILAPDPANVKLIISLIAY